MAARQASHHLSLTPHSPCLSFVHSSPRLSLALVRLQMGMDWIRCTYCTFPYPDRWPRRKAPVPDHPPRGVSSQSRGTVGSHESQALAQSMSRHRCLSLQLGIPGMPILPSSPSVLWARSCRAEGEKHSAKMTFSRKLAKPQPSFPSASLTEPALRASAQISSPVANEDWARVLLFSAAWEQEITFACRCILASRSQSPSRVELRHFSPLETFQFSVSG